MGVAVIDPDKTHQYRPVFFDAAVPNGLRGLWFLNTDADNAAFNLATQKRSKIIGDPVGYPAQIRFTASLNYIETEVAETAAMTVMAVARSTASMADNANRPVYVSNNSSPAVDPSGPPAYGYSLWPLDADSMISAASHFTNAGSTTSTSGGRQLDGPSTGTWAFHCSRVDNVNNTLDNLTVGQSTTVAFPYPRNLSRGTMRIGANYNGAYGGFCDMAFVAMWSRFLSDAERDVMYSQIKTVLHDVFALVV